MGNLSDLNLDVEGEAKSTFETLPPGDYEVVITGSECKPNQKTVGEHINVTFEIIEGDAKGRLLFAIWNIKNANSTAEKIGRSELAACCKAVGVVNPQDTCDLHDKPLIVRVGIDKKDTTRNVIKGYMAIDAAKTPPVATAEPAKASVPKATAATGKKPWQK